MQTFLISTNSFDDTAKVLDNKRLNKQILESDQMINAVETNNDKFYKNHPCRKMWDSYVKMHKVYRDSMLSEWVNRGFNSNRGFYNTTFDKVPHWMVNEEVFEKICKSHRKALLIKDFEHYSQYFEDDIDGLVLEGVKCTGYLKSITRGKYKGTKRFIKPTQHKQEFIRDNNIYYWVI